jgi:hypothetical protein
MPPKAKKKGPSKAALETEQQAGAYLHSFTFQLNLSALYVTGGVHKGVCSPRQGGFRGCLGCVGCFLVTDTARVELRSGRV